MDSQSNSFAKRRKTEFKSVVFESISPQTFETEWKQKIGDVWIDSICLGTRDSPLEFRCLTLTNGIYVFMLSKSVPWNLSDNLKIVSILGHNVPVSALRETSYECWPTFELSIHGDESLWKWLLSRQFASTTSSQ